MGKPLVVIGNGPSLKGFDFRTINVDALGMNAAYRHWDRIGWYPRFYCCLDDELINTHQHEIRRLVEGGKVEGAFLSGRMLELHPETARDDRYKFLDQFVPYWHRVRGSKFGLEFIESSAFKTDAPTKLTTGSYAVRYAAYRGYEEIGVIGIDLRYVEVIPEAKAGEGLQLIVTETPKSNPNYFFDDYQRVGDTYQVPNPAQHNGLLHVQSFNALKDDLRKYSPAVTVSNCNRESVLFDEKIFPFVDLPAWLARHGSAGRDKRIRETVRQWFSRLPEFEALGKVVDLLESQTYHSAATREIRREANRRLADIRGALEWSEIGRSMQRRRMIYSYISRLSLIAAGDPENDLHASWDRRW